MFSPSRFLASIAWTTAAERVAGAVDDDVSWLSAPWSKQLTVSTTRTPAAWARFTRLTRSWLSYPSQPAPDSSSDPSGFTPMLK